MTHGNSPLRVKRDVNLGGPNSRARDSSERAVCMDGCYLVCNVHIYCGFKRDAELPRFPWKCTYVGIVEQRGIPDI